MNYFQYFLCSLNFENINLNLKLKQQVPLGRYDNFSLNFARSVTNFFNRIFLRICTIQNFQVFVNTIEKRDGVGEGRRKKISDVNNRSEHLQPEPLYPPPSPQMSCPDRKPLPNRTWQSRSICGADMGMPDRVRHVGLTDGPELKPVGPTSTSSS